MKVMAASVAHSGTPEEPPPTAKAKRKQQSGQLELVTHFFGLGLALAEMLV